MSKPGIRAFIAIDLPLEVKETLEDIQFDLLDHVSEEAVRWVKPETMHLTVRFLGDGVGPEVIPPICDRLDHIGAATPAFSLKMGQLGCFPDRRKPRVLWIGLASEDSAMLRSIRRQIDELLEPLGWDRDKRGYTPHLTLGYVQNQREVANSKIPYGTYVTPRQWSVKKVQLYHSQLTKQGPRYKIIHSANLSLT
ncbi:MAG: RNA 2',3'-cyclic phosphodiesterase [Chloroflexota bacterium]